uniref:Reverse transcriptase zinc-binding domain-containing protein n=1 Tax=Sus scrofa TaxID=9823 RepID=A0A8D1N7D6_PIG
MKRQPIELEKIFANGVIKKQLIFNVYKQLIQFNIEKNPIQLINGQKKLNRYFSKEELHMANRHMKRCSTSLLTGKMQIKPTMRYHLTPLRTIITKKNTNNKCWQGCGEKGTLVHCWWKCKLIHPLWKTVWSFLKELKIELLFDLAIPFLGMYLKKIPKR